jgi:hypothetical protein
MTDYVQDSRRQATSVLTYLLVWPPLFSEMLETVGKQPYKWRRPKRNAAIKT